MLLLSRLFIGFQWTLIVVQFVVAEICPDVPEEVEIQIDRQNFIRSKILDKVADDDMENDEVLERDTMNSVDKGVPQEVYSHVYSCFGITCSVLPCCRSHKGKYLDRKRKMDGRPEVTVKQYPLLATKSSQKNPLNQQVRAEF